MERAYRVFFNRSHVHYNDSYIVDVMANNAKEACKLVYDRYYTFEPTRTGKLKKTGFCPKNRKAKRIDYVEYPYRRYVGKNKMDVFEV